MLWRIRSQTKEHPHLGSWCGSTQLLRVILHRHEDGLSQRCKRLTTQRVLGFMEKCRQPNLRKENRFDLLHRGVFEILKVVFHDTGMIYHDLPPGSRLFQGTQDTKKSPTFQRARALTSSEIHTVLVQMSRFSGKSFLRLSKSSNTVRSFSKYQPLTVSATHLMSGLAKRSTRAMTKP